MSYSNVSLVATRIRAVPRLNNASSLFWRTIALLFHPRYLSRCAVKSCRLSPNYVELEEENIEINLESDHDLTAVIANLPIRSIRLIPPPEEKPSVTTSQTPSQTPSETVQSQTPGETVQSLPVAPELEFDLSELDRKFEVAQDIAKQE
ncbi:MAG: hypothetical protein HC935_02720 [Pseudanabaena sp. SU_2_4]|nr:hypothetical protein [Pseudanabaena sp. SU_2_4]